MDHLSSCYFCGTALDRPVQTVRLGDAADGDEPPSLTLCRPCRRKLERVFEVAGVGGSVDVEITGPDAVPDDAATAADDLEWDKPGESAEAGTDAADEAAGDESPEEILEEVSVDTAADEGDTDREADADDTATESAEPDDSAAEAGEDEDTAAAAGEESEESAGSAAESEDSDADAGGDSPDSAGSAEAGAEPADDNTDGAASGGDSGGRTLVDGSGGSSVSALEYNKVIRLLQNRDFPVDREEIVIIASNAYDLSRAECGAILDVAVERDLLAESNGKLYRPG